METTLDERFQNDYSCFCDIEAESNEQLFNCAINFLKKNDHISYDSAIATFKLLLIQAYQLKYERESVELN